MNHPEMIDVLKSARFRWLLSEYEHLLYLEAFGQPFWRKEVQLCATNFRRNNDHGRAQRVECLWRNYYQQAPDLPHDVQDEKIWS